MTESDLEQRLRRMFDERTAALDSTLSGPALRAAAVARRRPARLPAALATAATVAGIALASAALDHSAPPPPRSPAGHSVPNAPPIPDATAPPTPNVPSSVPAPTPRIASRPTSVRPSQSGQPVLSLSTVPADSSLPPGRVGQVKIVTPRSAASTSSR